MGIGVVAHRHSDAVQLDGGTDYRRMHTEEDDAPVRTVVTAADGSSAALAAADAELCTIFHEVVATEASVAEAGEGAVQEEVGAAVVPVLFGRTLEVRAQASGVAWFSFEELCDRPVGAPDFVAVAAHFHTVFLAGVPQLSLKRRDLARRFITLVDELYNRGGRLYVSSQVAVDDLFCTEGSGYTPEELLEIAEQRQFEAEALEGARKPMEELEAGGLGIAGENRTGLDALDSTLYTGEDEVFAFARARSRLMAMQSRRYLLITRGYA